MNNGANDIMIPPEFSGNGQLILFTRYGDPRTPGWENKWITKWQVHKIHPWFPEKEILIHKHFWPALHEAFNQLVEAGYHYDIETCDCCYEVRTMRGSDTVLSAHSWGAAIDLNISKNPVGSPGNWKDDFIGIMERNSIVCGQRWEGRKEPMHFSMVNG